MEKYFSENLLKYPHSFLEINLVQKNLKINARTTINWSLLKVIQKNR